MTAQPPTAQQRVLADLAAENDDLDARVAGLDEAGWATPTPAAGWDVAHQLAHLAWTDHASLLAELRLLLPERAEVKHAG